MISYADYLQLLPKTELHCHLVSTMRPATLQELALRRRGQGPSDLVER